MYTDFNHFHRYNKKFMAHKSNIICRPPHLYSVTALPGKMPTTADIDAHI